MAGDFNKPVNTDAYATLLQFIRENIAELAKGLDASTAANIPSGAIRFNSTTKRWEKWNGSAWSELVAKASESYNIRTAQADDVVVGASTAKSLGQIGAAANSSGVSNANSYLTSGAWFVANADATTNWPAAGVGGFLQVVINSTYIRQTFFVHNANQMHSRYSTDSGATWSAWRHITADADWNAASGADGFIANKPTLGTAAAADLSVNSTDPTPGRVMTRGDWGLGSNVIQITSAGAINGLVNTGLYGHSSANALLVDAPANIAGVILHFNYSSASAAQIWMPVTLVDPNAVYVRCKTVSTWTPWRLVYTQGNIVGSVLQESGVPTGAIIEKGSNSSGNYVRFADGTQMCWREINTAHPNGTLVGGVYISEAIATTMPAVFSGSYPVAASVSCVDSSSGFWAVGRASTSSWTTRIFRNVTFSNGNVDTIELFAIGRWF